jgi:hypothetical protein
MSHLPARALRFLRLSALMLLVLSLMARPVVEQLGGTHEVEHAVLAAADAGHGHGHPGSGPIDDHGHAHADPDPAGDPDHTRGLHGLMHQAECGATAAVSSSWALALAIRPAESPPVPEPLAPHSSIPASPFRPPIA